MHELGKDDMELLVQLGTLSLPNILSEVKISAQNVTGRAIFFCKHTFS